MNYEVGVYKIENTNNNKKYIGRGIIQDRFYKHKFHLNRGDHKNDYLQKSWNKYGQDDFMFEPLIYCSISDSIHYEKEIIKSYKTHKEEYGYNLTMGGEDGNVTEYGRQKISEKLSGREFSEETKEKLRKAGNDDNRDTYILDNEEVKKIVELLKQTDLTQKEIGGKFNVDYSVISSINNGIQWNNITGLEEDERIRSKEKSNKIYAKSARNGDNSKLDIEEVKKIKRLLKTDMKQSDISDRFNVSSATITRIKKGKSWSDVTLEDR